MSDSSAPTHLAGQGGATPPAEPTPSPSRRYAVLALVVVLVVAAAGGLIWFEHRGSGPVVVPPGPSSSGGPQGALTAPQALSASTGAGTVALTWKSVDGATSYVVTRDGSTVSGANLTTTSFTDTLTDTSQHTYTVAAVNSTGPGPTAVVTGSAGTAVPSGTDHLAAEDALVATLPTSAVDIATCASYPSGEGDNVDASVTCSANGTAGNPPTSIYAYHFVSTDALKAATAETISFDHLTTGACTTSPPATTTWFFESAPDTTIGALLCYDYESSHVVQWDYDDGQVSIEGWTSEGTLPGLVTWWSKSVGPLR